MMLPTHALVGLAIAAPVSVAFPEYASVILLSGLFGGVFPDFDLYVGHRKTLHFPVYYSVCSLVLIPAAVFVQTAWIIGVTIALVAAAVHSIMDIFGGGLELRPWEGRSERAVYDHFRDYWIAPRRWVRYDGAPEDLFLSLSVAGLLLFVVNGQFRWIVVGALVVSVSYVLVRRPLATIAETLVEGVLKPRLPDSLLAYLPARYLR
jgi:hypothetical protein